MELQGQIQIFAVTVVTGAVLGLIFDFYRVMRGIFRLRFVLTGVADFVYWIIATAVVTVALLMSNWLELRFYIFMGLVGGAVLYFRTFSRIAIHLIIRSLRLVAFISRWIKKIVHTLVFLPMAFVFRIVAVPIRFGTRQVKRPFSYASRRLATLMQSPKDIPPEE